MQDVWMERLSEYLDGEMDRSERASLEGHLEECAECAAVLADLKRVRARARELCPVPVPEDLWPRIETAIAEARTKTPRAAPDASMPARVIRIRHPGGGRASFSLPELLAACLAVAILSGGAVYALLRHQALVSRPTSKAEPVTVARAPELRTSLGATSEGTHPAGGQEPEREPAPSSAVLIPAGRTDAGAVTASRTTETPHEEAISELRKALMSRRNQLDPATIRTLESNLAIIDLAIDQAKRALAADSANTYVKEHLAETLRRKVELLQRATMLASTSSSGVIR